MKPRREIRMEDITCVVDTREQLPLDLSPLKSVSGTLPTGDYSVLGLENVVALERKSLSDLIGCVGQGRERFEREIQRLLAYETRAIIVEATWGNLELGQWRSQVTPQAAVGSVLGWIARGVPVLMAGTREHAARMMSRLLFLAARRRWREAQAFCESLKLAGGE